MAQEEKKDQPKERNLVVQVINITVDRNYLAQRSHELLHQITENNLKDPEQKDGAILSNTLILKGANEMIMEILEKFDK